MARALPQSEAMFQSLFHPCTGSQRKPLIFEARKNVLDAYRQLRDTHPAFPEVLRDFQAIKSTTNSSACTLLPLQAALLPENYDMQVYQLFGLEPFPQSI